MANITNPAIVITYGIVEQIFESIPTAENLIRNTWAKPKISEANMEVSGFCL